MGSFTVSASMTRFYTKWFVKHKGILFVGSSFEQTFFAVSSNSLFTQYLCADFIEICFGEYRNALS